MRVSMYKENRARIIEMIESAQKSHSRPPSVRTLAASCEVGVATMHSYLNQMSQEGLVEWQPKSHRSIRLTQQAIQQL